MSRSLPLVLAMLAATTVAGCAERVVPMSDRPLITSAEAMRPCKRSTVQPLRLLTPKEIDRGWPIDRDRLEECADRHDALIAEVQRRS